MKNNFLKSWVKKSLTLIAIFAMAVGCQNDDKNVNAQGSNDPNLERLGVPKFSEGYLKSITPLKPADYQANIGKYRPDLNTAEARQVIQAALPSSYYLPTLPIGNQGNEGSCVGWGVGYAAHSITRYINNPIHNSDWSGALRSAAYVYNQIKIGNCAGGSYPADAMNLLYNKGECSNAQMPYVNGGCYTMPTAQQNTWASQRKTSGWNNISATNVNDIKYYLSQKYPVPVCFDYNQSFVDIQNNGYVWSSVYGQRNGGHCVCIVGYDDVKQRFKVANSWGASWGLSGYFYVTYGAVQNGAFNWAAIMYPKA
ncbi:MAG: C1 family peptidase [Flavobacterium sp.]